MSNTTSPWHVVRTWTNGSKAEVDLISGPAEFVIRKRYRMGRVAGTAMVREYLGLKLLQHLEIVPKVVQFLPLRRQLSISFIKGDRVLEWVMARYGEPDVDLASFASFHGLDERHDIRDAFQRFRSAQEPEAVRLKRAIVDSYAKLHRWHCVHGDPSPRNLLYDGCTVYLIDFDHWRPSVAAAKIDGRTLQRWYGVPQ